MEYSPFTEQMRAMLPQWMKMAKDETSVGAQFLNVFGLEFRDVQQYLDEISSNQFIDTADLSQIDITYKVPLALPVVTDLEEVETVTGVKGEVRHKFLVVDTIKRFYTGLEDENLAILDRHKGIVYIRPNSYLIDQDKIKPMDYIIINGTAHYEYTLHHVWNAFDEFGLLLGVERLFSERNESFKERILDVFRKPANSTQEGMINALSRDLGLENTEIKINEFANKAFRDSLLDKNGAPTRKFIKYVDQVNKILGFTWDNMTWGEAYWRSIEESNIGLEYLPHVWDASMGAWRKDEIQSGVGDEGDLLVEAPRDEKNMRKFKAYVGLRGRESGTELIDPELQFKYKITAEGTILSSEYKPEEYRYTIISSEIVQLHFIVRGFKNYLKEIAVNFDPELPGYAYDADNAVEIITGNTYLSNPQDSYIKIKIDMSTRSPQSSPSMDQLSIKWRDSGGTLNDFVFDAQTDFTRNDATVNTTLADLDVTIDGQLELGYGDFYYKIDTEGSWKEGQHSENVEITREGSVKLILPGIE